MRIKSNFSGGNFAGTSQEWINHGKNIWQKARKTGGARSIKMFMICCFLRGQ
jgi:hypothetical protein